MSDEQPNPLGDWLAQLDQMTASLRDFAAVLGGYRDELVDQGFTREEALEIVVGFQASMLAQNTEDPGD